MPRDSHQPSPTNTICAYSTRHCLQSKHYVAYRKRTITVRAEHQKVSTQSLVSARGRGCVASSSRRASMSSACQGPRKLELGSRLEAYYQPSRCRSGSLAPVPGPSAIYKQPYEAWGSHPKLQAGSHAMPCHSSTWPCTVALLIFPGRPASSFMAPPWRPMAAANQTCSPPTSYRPASSLGQRRDCGDMFLAACLAPTLHALPCACPKSNRAL